MDDVGIFLSNVVTTDEGWFELLVGPPEEKPHQEWFRWPEQREDIVARINQIEDANVWFSPHLFRERNSHKQYVITQTRTLVVDLDNADVTDIRHNPTYLLETSIGRHQGFWIVKAPPPNFEELSKKLTYTVENADVSGWPIGHKFRVPGRRNFKYDPPPLVRVVVALSSERIYAVEEIELWVGDTQVDTPAHQVDDQWINNPLTTFHTGPRELLEKYRSALGAKAVTFFNQTQADRSEALWALMLALFRAGASRDEVFWMAKHSANNKFKDNRYAGDRDLAKDVDRAQKADKTDRTDINQIVQLAERTPGTQNDKKRLVAKIVIQDLLRKGEFIYTDDGRNWYLHANAGRPIPVGKRSEQLDSLLDMAYGLNAADGGYQNYTTNHLTNFTLAKGRRAVGAVLSSYDGESLFLHSGKADVYRIQPNSVTRHPDGQYGVLFPWRPADEEMILIDDEPISDDWASWMFEGWFDNLVELDPDEATLLIRVWFLFILFRDMAVSRPILALLGQPGSGKSTLFRLIYTLLYGRHKSLSAISTPDDFDFLVASDPLVVFDNTDSWVNWVPDRFALSASASDLVKRKLYTDSDTVTLKRQAILGVTAHDPRFNRADVVDRMIILNFEKRLSFIAEGKLIERISGARGRIWAGIVRDIQKVLVTPDPPLEEIPTFRVSDFARIGARISKAIGLHREFVDLIDKLRRSQTALTLSEEDLLIGAIQRWHISRNGDTPEFASVGYLWEQLKLFEPGIEKQYQSAPVLARKLWTMQSSLKSVFNVEYTYDSTRGVRMWKIDPPPTTAPEKGAN